MSTELVAINSADLALNGGNERFISFIPETDADRAKLYNAMNNNNGKVSDLINKSIKLADAVVELVTIPKKDGEPGEMVDVWRTTLILDDGTSYGTISNGIRNSLRNLAGVYGTLHFDPAISVKIEQVETNKGRTFTIRLI